MGGKAGERIIDEKTSALRAFCAKHGIAVDDRRDAQLKLRFDEVENVEARIREAYRLGKDAGKDPIRFRTARLDLGEQGVTSPRYYLPKGHRSAPIYGRE